MIKEGTILSKGHKKINILKRGLHFTFFLETSLLLSPNITVVICITNQSCGGVDANFFAKVTSEDVAVCSLFPPRRRAPASAELRDQKVTEGRRRRTI